MRSVGIGAVAGAMVLGLAPSAHAGDPGVVDAVEVKYRSVEGMRARFTQTVKSTVYGDDTQTGVMTLKRPSKMRWDFEGDGRLFVADGSALWILNRSDNQVIRFSDAASQAGSAQTLLTSLDKVGELFVVSELPDEAGHTLLLKPKQGESFKQVELHLDGSLLVEKVVITDPFETVTELVFHQVTLDAQVPDDLFVFQVPDGAEVIDAGSP